MASPCTSSWVEYSEVGSDFSHVVEWESAGGDAHGIEGEEGQEQSPEAHLWRGR